MCNNITMLVFFEPTTGYETRWEVRKKDAKPWRKKKKITCSRLAELQGPLIAHSISWAALPPLERLFKLNSARGMPRHGTWRNRWDSLSQQVLDVHTNPCKCFKRTL
ncbi:unnamed protein product [Ixodes persulcatus]